MQVISLPAWLMSGGVSVGVGVFPFSCRVRVWVFVTQYSLSRKAYTCPPHLLQVPFLPSPALSAHGAMLKSVSRQRTKMLTCFIYTLEICKAAQWHGEKVRGGQELTHA